MGDGGEMHTSGRYLLRTRVPAGRRTAILATTFALTAAFLPVAPAYAYRVVPLALQLEAAGGAAQGQVHVINDTAEPVAIQVSIEAPEGAAPGDAGRILAVPPQMVLEPGAIQAVRIHWQGEGAAPGARTFRIVTEQLPVDLEGQDHDGTRLTVLVRYEGKVRIVPATAQTER